MKIYAVIDLVTNEQINTIVASSEDIPPDNCRLVELLERHYWDSIKNEMLFLEGTQNAN
jgi:hypothetical protein